MKELIKKGKRHAYLYKGNTLIWEKGKNSYTYVRYRGQQITAVNTVNAPISEAVLNGQTLVNVDTYRTTDDFKSLGKQVTLEDNGYIVVRANGEYQNFMTNFNGMLKPNTKYIYIIEIAENTLENDENENVVRFFSNGNIVGETPFVNQTYNIKKGDVGTFKVVVTTQADFTEYDYIFNSRNFVDRLATTGIIKFRFMSFEYVEGMENWDIPYFEGMASVQAPTVQTVGKNLYNPRTAYLDEANNQFIYNMIDLNPNSMYSFYAKGNVISFELYNDNNQPTGGIDENASLNRICFGTTSEEVKVKLGFYNGTTNGIEDVDFSNVQLQEGSVFTQYELATPVVTAVQPQITDQNGNTINSLYAFNGTTHITTGSAALLPTVDVEVPSTVEMFLHNQREANEGTVYL